MKIIKEISEHKRIKKSQPLQTGFKRIEAIVENFGIIQTRHLDIKQ